MEWGKHVSYEEMYERWLDANPSSTWSNVITALRTMNLHQLSMELESKYTLATFAAISKLLSPYY